MSKYNVYYWDDEEFFLERFAKRHSQDYDIHTFTNFKDLTSSLTTTKELPDIILLDLYKSRSVEEADFEEKNRQAEESLKNLANALEDVKVKVQAVREPIGIGILKDIRKIDQAKNIPVVIYTRRGLLILDDRSIREVADNNGKWMLKNSKYGHEHISEDTEKIWIDSIILDAKQNVCNELNVPEKVTLKWVFDNVPGTWWLSFIVLISTVFVAGVQASRLGFIKEIFLNQ